MKRILVPTDFSEQAENALKVAAQLAKKYDAEIFLLHMLELPANVIDPATRDNSDTLPESLFYMKLAHKRFSELLAKDFLDGIEVIETVLFHEAFEGIMKVAQENECDFIVMGSQGATGVKEFFVGSNTEKVVRNSPIPVLVIKQEIPLFEIKNFVYATDFTPAMQKPFEKAVEFAKKIDATMHLVYINTSNKFKTSDQMEKKMGDFSKNIDYDNYTLTLHNDESIEKGILNFAGKKKAGLIGLGTHGRKGISHFLNGSIGEDLVNHAQIPVVTFKI